MGQIREDRLYIRRLEKLGLIAAFVTGAVLAPGTITGDISRMLVTFLGLFSASLLPTITLLVNGMTANGRSVQGLEKLNAEISAAMDALLFMFGCIAVAFLGLMILSIPPTFLNKIPFLTTEILPRFGQAVVLTSVIAIVRRSSQIPAILRKTLAMRKDITIEEARKKLKDKLLSASEIRESFSRHPDFGEVINIDQNENK